MSNPNTAQAAPAIAGPAAAPAAAGPLAPASPVGTTGGTPVPPPLSTASLAAAIGRQLSGEEYNLNPQPVTPAATAGQEPSPEVPSGEHSESTAAAEITTDDTDATDGTENTEPETGGNPAFARLRIEAKEAKTKLKEVTAELEKLKGKGTETTEGEPLTPALSPERGEGEGTLGMPDVPEMRKAEAAEASLSQVVNWARKAVTRLERAQRNGGEAEVLTALRQEMGEHATALPQDPNAALDWLDDLHVTRQDLLQAARVHKEVLSRQVQEAVRDVQTDSRQFAESVMPAVFVKDSPEAKLVNDAKQLFPGIEKNPLFYTWVVKAIKGHQVLEAELAAKAEGNGHAPANRLKPAQQAPRLQVPGARPSAKLPGSSSHLPARPAEAPVNGSSHWMAQMRAAKTPAERDAAKAEWQKALAAEMTGGQPA